MPKLELKKKREVTRKPRTKPINYTYDRLKTGMYSKVLQEVVKKANLTEGCKEALDEARLDFWKRFDNPTLQLASRLEELDTIIAIKRMNGDIDDVLNKDIIAASKLALDIQKEINRLNTVSADKKFDAMNMMDEFEIELPSNENEEVIDVTPDNAKEE